MLPTAARLIHLLLYAGAAAGCLLILYAGFRESRGDLTGARRLARIGGFAMAGTTLCTVASGPAVMALLPPEQKQALLESADHTLLFLAVGAILTMISGFVGLLAGLTGKPRPTGYFAALLFAVSVALILAADLAAGTPDAG